MDKEQLIFDLFKLKSSTKQDVYTKTTNVFRWIDEALKEIADHYSSEFNKVDNRVAVEYKSLGEFAAQLNPAAAAYR